jgi:hypothetical protein
MAGMAAEETAGESTTVEPCDEGGEAPCFAHLLEDDDEERPVAGGPGGREVVDVERHAAHPGTSVRRRV